MSHLTDTIFDDADRPARSSSDPDDRTEARLEDALRGLKPVYREVICLRAYCGMSFHRIADAMRLPSENTASVLFLRARAELRNRL